MSRRAEDLVSLTMRMPRTVIIKLKALAKERKAKTGEAASISREAREILVAHTPDFDPERHPQLWEDLKKEEEKLNS